MGLDATDAFESVGHSEHARTMMLKLVVGQVIASQHVDHPGNPWKAPLDVSFEKRVQSPFLTFDVIFIR